MILKNFFFNLYLLNTNIYFFLFITISLLFYKLISSSLRYKFFYFFLNILAFAIWGFLYNLDGIILILIVTELTVLLLLLLTYIQLYSYYSFITKNSHGWLLPIIFLIIIGWNPFNITINYTSWYGSLTAIISSDFYILYYLLFNKLPLLVIFLTLIISLFSFFFILLYFNLKLIKNKYHSSYKSIYFLRKQTLTKQTQFKSNLFTFQN